MKTIREYERIFADECPQFDELSRFADASEFLSLGWKYVQAKNYVGVIRLPSGYQIEILPKIAGDEDKLRGLVVEMLRTLKGFTGKKFLDADLNTSRVNLYEIFIRAYLEMVLELVKRGLRSSYTVHEENLNYFKGKLLVKENLRQNIAHREKFFVAFDEYNLDRAEHRLIKATLLKIVRTTKENFRLANKLLSDFDSVTQSVNYRKDFAKVSIDRTNRDYKAIMKWTEIFLRGESFTSFAGNARATAILFPMERLFEAYVTEHIKKNFSDLFTVKTQVKEKFLFDEPTNTFGLRPDIILEGSNERIIFDAKWKFTPSEDDMYQMFAYAKRYGAKKIFLLCPPQADENTFYRAEDFSVKIHAIDLFKINESTKKLLAELTRS